MEASQNAKFNTIVKNCLQTKKAPLSSGSSAFHPRAIQSITHSFVNWRKKSGNHASQTPRIPHRSDLAKIGHHAFSLVIPFFSPRLQSPLNQHTRKLQETNRELV